MMVIIYVCNEVGTLIERGFKSENSTNEPLPIMTGCFVSLFPAEEKDLMFPLRSARPDHPQCS
jgi:hypothetical protein